MEPTTADLTAVVARDAIACGQLSPETLLADCIARIESLDPVVNALVVPAFERAAAEATKAAQAVKRGAKLGPLHGLPVAIKDIQDAAGIATTYGSPALQRNVPATDAGIVARIRAAGGIVIGKTNVPELSIGANTINPLFGATGNPFDPSLTCGGSSGGSAVAVACRMAPLATGSDHGGSLRIPACYCGVVGVRATPGTVPNEQRLIAQTYYSVQGPMARNVEDAALLLSVIADRDPSIGFDPMAFPLDGARFASLETVDLSEVRVGYSADLGGVLVSKAVRETFASRVAAVAAMVEICEPCEIDLRRATSVDWHLRQDIFAAQYAQQSRSWPDDINPNVRATFDAAQATPMLDIATARKTQGELVREFAALYDRFDVVLVPGVSTPPFPWTSRNPAHIDGVAVKNYMAWLELTSALTVVGHPVVTLPCGASDEIAGQRALPFGLQIVGPMYADHRLLAIAAAFEREFAKHVGLTMPVPDFQLLAATSSECRTLGREIKE